MNTVLFGFKGSGKTHFGKLLAAELGVPFIDTDELLFNAHNMKTEEIHALYGEEKFRLLESEIVRGLAEVKNSVIALGGGAVLDPQNVAFLQTIGRLIYLDCPFEALRIAKTPSFAKGQDLREIYEFRKKIYESIPAARIVV